MSSPQHTGGTDPLSLLLAARGRLVADGGMGTSLFELGLQAGSTPELWNVEHPDRVASVHQGFVDAGADIILSNTFGGTRSRLDLDRLGARVEELNLAGVGVARGVADAAGREVLVAGSVGPTGRLFEPLGDLDHDVAVDQFREQMAALDAGGADLIWIETLSSVEELAAAVGAARSTSLPIVTTMSFDTNGRTMMGTRPSELADWWAQQPDAPAAVGANCGIGPADVIAAAAGIHARDPDLVVVAKANCGLPQMVDGVLRHPASEEDMGVYAELALDAGASIIGSCCGSVPAHCAQIREVVDRYEPRAFSLEEVERRLGPVSGVDAGEEAPRRRRRRREPGG